MKNKNVRDVWSDAVQYCRIADEVARIVIAKQAAYGDSFGKSGTVLSVMYPNGIPVDKLDDALVVVRVLDKLFRIATDKDAFGEDPWKDIAGHALLAIHRNKIRRAEKTN